jgi:predicted extracellular nuclease
VNLAAGGCNVQMFFNDSATAGLTTNLTGTVAAGDVYVVAQSSAAAAILAQADHTNGTSCSSRRWTRRTARH